MKNTLSYALSMVLSLVLTIAFLSLVGFAQQNSGSALGSILGLVVLVLVYLPIFNAVISVKWRSSKNC